MLGDKFRFRFAKTGTLRLLSHHDLMRCLERMLRRADLPFKSTAGFHPSPRVVFALSLPLGVAGLNEVIEIEFTRSCDSEEVLAKLCAQAPIGLKFTQVSIVPMKATAIPRRIVYCLTLLSDRVPVAIARCEELLAQEKVWVDRLKPVPKRLNIRPYLRGLHVETSREGISQEFAPGAANSETAEFSVLVLDLWVTQTGTARVDELLKLLDLDDLPEAGAVVERATVEIRDEVSNPDSADVPPTGPAETLPLDPAAIAALVRQDEEQSAAVGWSVSPASPVVE
ncbi:MAG TPA: TIGR03936 family radical SAM-associated protein [Gemmata sp.]|jgi:radical SAM-linked protein|nr:TIGR03936 family radical SAM-associated protein [Gemmata sp.]